MRCEFAERIERESARVDRILPDLLDLARPREIRLEPIDLKSALGVARALVLPQPACRDCTISYDLPEDLPRVLGEEHYVVQVLVNLMTNAAKANAQQVRITGAAVGDTVTIELADDGSGIAPELLPRLFEPFVTTSSPGQGTGLGLALSHATMERIGGSISARAGEKSGAIFSSAVSPGGLIEEFSAAGARSFRHQPQPARAALVGAGGFPPRGTRRLRSPARHRTCATPRGCSSPPASPSSSSDPDCCTCASHCGRPGAARGNFSSSSRRISSTRAA